MRVRVSHDEESECSDPDFDARHQASDKRAPVFGIALSWQDVYDGLTVI